ncbi:MAG: aldose 1-epimerase family protein [Sphingobacteriia bacterium]|nr:aldose 1-epimerase family protein [Sphingobacteriia bacterium]
MALFAIENNIVKVEIADKGAELQSIFNKETRLEYLWDANPDFWAKKSPVLFPIVGGLKNNTFFFNDNPYQLNRHGFARDSIFEVVLQEPDALTFLLKPDESTRKNYPFEFEFYVEYKLSANKLSVTYIVKNTDEKEMYFSVGAHPAFKVPLTSGTGFNDWFLQFDQNETEGIWPLTSDGLIKMHPVPFFQGTDKIELNKQLFYKDALVFKHLKSASISILSNKTKHGLTVAYHHFPYMGIWSAKDADFVCIEPWCGIADSENSLQQLNEKEGINALQPNNLFERSWSVAVF